MYTLWDVSCGPLFQKCPNHDPSVAQTLPSLGPSNLFFLGLNQYAQVCFIPNFRFLASVLTDNLNFKTHSGSYSVSH